MSEPGFIGKITRRPEMSERYAAIWSNSPLLGNLSDETYLGRVVVEIWDLGELSLNTAYPDEPSKTALLLERARVALERPETAVAATSPWSNEPVLQPGIAPPGQRLQGRIVIEVWNNETVMSIAGSVPQSELEQRALQKLRQIAG